MGTQQSRAWAAKYTAPLIARFNQAIPGFNFTLDDIFGMQELCGYDVVIRNRTDFCNVFTAEAWLSFEYTNDLMYFYSIGYGNPIAPQLGTPWVRSALDILSANDTSIFNQSLYISFTHREEPPLVMTALGLFNNSAYYPGLDVNSTMPTDRINYAREWKTSNILPFLGHVAIERLQCSNASSPSSTTAGSPTSTVSTALPSSTAISSSIVTSSLSSSSFPAPTTLVNAVRAHVPRQDDSGDDGVWDNGAFIRVLVNGAPIPIPDCQDGPGDSCALGSFADYIQSRVAKYGDFIGACGINDTVTNRTDLISLYNS